MSVDKIAPLPNSPVDPLALRTGGPAVFPPPAPPPPPAAAKPEQTASAQSVSFDSLSLPLPITIAHDGEAPPAGAIGASYARETMDASLARLVGGRLPTEAVAREVANLLRDTAAELDMPLARFIDGAAVVNGARLPAHNRAAARFTLQTSLLAVDDDGETRAFDLYLSRASARQWEAAVFRRDEATSLGFPYPAAPINIDRVVIDPATGQILACVASQLAAREFAPETSASPHVFFDALRAGMLVGGTIATTIILAKTVSTFVAFGFIVAALGLILRAPSRAGNEKNRRFTRLRPRRPSVPRQ